MRSYVANRNLHEQFAPAKGEHEIFELQVSEIVISAFIIPNIVITFQDTLILCDRFKPENVSEKQEKYTCPKPAEEQKAFKKEPRSHFHCCFSCVFQINPRMSVKLHCENCVEDSQEVAEGNKDTLDKLS